MMAASDAEHHQHAPVVPSSPAPADLLRVCPTEDTTTGLTTETFASLADFLVGVFDANKPRGPRKMAQQATDIDMPYFTLGLTMDYNQGPCVAKATEKIPLAAEKVNRFFRDNFGRPGTVVDSGLVCPGRKRCGVGGRRRSPRRGGGRTNDQENTVVVATTDGSRGGQEQDGVSGLHDPGVVDADKNTTDAEKHHSLVGEAPATSKFSYSTKGSNKFPYTTVTINDSYSTRLHCDTAMGAAVIITLGSFRGGETWIYDDSLTPDHPDAVCLALRDPGEQKALQSYRRSIKSAHKDHSKAVGKVFSSRDRFVLFDTRLPHKTMDFELLEGGRRICMVFFVHSCLKGRTFRAELLERLRTDFGFPLVSARDCEAAEL